MPGLRPGKKYRTSVRCENRGKSRLITKLNTCFCPCFPAVLNYYRKEGKEKDK